MINLTLKQLRYFEALAQQQHFGRAAAFCSISQPALSVQIKEMETQLGRPLFERGAREVRLTAFGAEISAKVRGILSAVDDLGDFARAVPRLIGRRLAPLRFVFHVPSDARTPYWWVSLPKHDLLRLSGPKMDDLRGECRRG